jgi:hypothetical protein
MRGWGSGTPALIYRLILKIQRRKFLKHHWLGRWLGRWLGCWLGSQLWRRLWSIRRLALLSLNRGRHLSSA